ncbi:sodium/calcium exchanger protein [Methanocella paludicola SANAE]|uniref:Sodium/calcium exchanger protein n=1 Tax=Methanocella paludicola (strain DSM 17711 / JCM 13418 / NBRC 101707 / SANAE) TaxID=304371 RepID=D1YZ28_METPS|nr:sodium:calcium antiporter [Methanocella paludicola]BAI61700.1 sodium/calcium exchanger protein [Methanocella paludicola SANAE]
MDVIIFLLSFIIILIGCELFTNGVEWAGKKLKLTKSAVGSILAAIGTALPETILPLIAILLLAGDAGTDIGTGSILGSPFTLSTIALFLCGLTALLLAKDKATGVVHVNGKMVRNNLRFFILAYGIAAIAAFIPEEYRTVKLIIAIGLLLIYIAYMVRTLKADGETSEEDETKCLYFDSYVGKLTGNKVDASAEPSLITIVAQVFISLAIIVLGANIFVNQVNEAATLLGISPLILSLLISPLATELPEMFNSILWVREGKDIFAVGNILGAMVYQSCILAFIGIVLTPWHFSPGDPTQLLQIISIAIALFSAAVLYFNSSKDTLKIWTLLLCGVFYIVLITLVLLRI